MPRIAVTKIFEFEACHHLPNYKGDCARVHGHSYKLEVTITNFKNNMIGCPDDTGMICDFKELKRLVQTNILDYVDHTDLNTLYDNPTAEIMVADFFQKLSKSIPVHLKIVDMKLWETSTSYASIC